MPADERDKIARERYVHGQGDEQRDEQREGADKKAVQVDAPRDQVAHDGIDGNVQNKAWQACQQHREHGAQRALPDGGARAELYLRTV